MRVQHAFLAGMAAAAAVALSASAAGPNYYESFTNALANGSRGLFTLSSLVDTNNAGPSMAKDRVPFAEFRQGGLAGIKLGTSMSEVVAAWGMPRLAASHCVFGPRFWYRRGHPFGEISLSFKGEKLVLICIGGQTARDLEFDNGLTGRAGRAEFEAALGGPSVRDAKDASLFNGQIAYRAGPIRTDFCFEPDAEASGKDHLLWASVRIETEAQREAGGEPKN
jgi:hypothetical protein